MKQTTKLLALLGLAPLAAFAVDVGGSLGLESGYRTDKIKIEGAAAGYADFTQEVKHLNGLSLGMNGRLTLNDVYFRANADYTWILSTPKWSAGTDGYVVSIDLPKKHTYDLGGALGYTFCLNDGEFSLAPEVGYSYTRANISSDSEYLNGSVNQSIGSVFIGCDFNWMFSTDWKFGLLFDFHFLGSRRSELFNVTALDRSTLTTGKYMGPEAKVAFDYSFTENWSMGFAYRFKYLFTGRDNGAGFTDAKQTWVTNQATVKFDYAF